MNTHGRAREGGEEAWRESSLGYPLHLRHTPARDSSVFGKHKQMTKDHSDRGTPSHQTSSTSSDNLGTSPGRLVIRI